MNCTDARQHLLDDPRPAEVDQHLAECADCRRAAEGERVMTELLEERLPRYSAPPRLKRRLEARFADTPRPSRWPRLLVPLAAAAALAAGTVVLSQRMSPTAAPDRMVAEAASDHLRVLISEHPLDVPSGGIHQVKPWFQGRLDFAPAVAFAGDADFPLEGGAIGYFIDRKAAVFVYKRRLHTISLLVFRADGLPWPTRGLQPMGRVKAHLDRSRGFSVVLWRDGELGYALASDVDRAELVDLGARIAGP